MLARAVRRLSTLTLPTAHTASVPRRVRLPDALAARLLQRCFVSDEAAHKAKPAETPADSRLASSSSGEGEDSPRERLVNWIIDLHRERERGVDPSHSDVPDPGPTDIELFDDRVTRYPKLPPLPPKVRHPCPFITDEEVEEYLVPLYHRAWVVDSSKSLRGSVLPDDATQPEASPQLVKDFHFTHASYASSFVTELGKLERTEKHHANTKREGRTVRIRLHTHTALPPAEPDDTRSLIERVREGLTLRDARLALRLELFFTTHLEMGAGERHSQRPPRAVRMQPHTLAEVEAWRTVPAPARDCGFCGGVHHAKDCSMRPEVPRNPCVTCGRLHWAWDCPERRFVKSHACKQCGELHFVWDCPMTKLAKEKKRLSKKRKRARKHAAV